VEPAALPRSRGATRSVALTAPDACASIEHQQRDTTVLLFEWGASSDDSNWSSRRQRDRFAGLGGVLRGDVGAGCHETSVYRTSQHLCAIIEDGQEPDIPLY
jgi:hypothetical protein